jgi:hypothetical protein
MIAHGGGGLRNLVWTWGWSTLNAFSANRWEKVYSPLRVRQKTFAPGSSVCILPRSIAEIFRPADPCILGQHSSVPLPSPSGTIDRWLDEWGQHSSVPLPSPSGTMDSWLDEWGLLSLHSFHGTLWFSGQKLSKITGGSFKETFYERVWVTRV